MEFVFKSVNKMLEDSIKKNWDRPALSNYQGVTMSYGEVASRIAKLHIALKETGESIYWLTLLKRTNLVTGPYDELLSLAEEIKRMLIASINTAKGTRGKQSSQSAEPL